MLGPLDDFFITEKLEPFPVDIISMYETLNWLAASELRDLLDSFALNLNGGTSILEFDQLDAIDVPFNKWYF